MKLFENVHVFMKDTVYLKNTPTDMASACDTGTCLDDVQVMTVREFTRFDEARFVLRITPTC